MVKLTNEQMLEIIGGASWIGAAFLNGFSRAITTIMDLGRTLGSSIRRGFNGKVCPVK